MKENLFSVIKCKIECAFCKEHNCTLRYQPHHSMMVDATCVACKKAFEEKNRKIFGKKF